MRRIFRFLLMRIWTISNKSVRMKLRILWLFKTGCCCEKGTCRTYSKDMSVIFEKRNELWLFILELMIALAFKKSFPRKLSQAFSVLSHSKPEGKHKVLLPLKEWHFQKLHHYWSHLWCSRNRSRRSWIKSCLWTCRIRFQNCMHFQTFPNQVPYSRCPGRNQCSLIQHAWRRLEVARLRHNQGKWLAWRPRRHSFHVQRGTRRCLRTWVLWITI